MKIIAGTYRGRRLTSLADDTIRPTSAKAREAIFHMLHHKRRADGVPLLQDSRFADICCGSGAMGLEALSRGAQHVTFVDKARSSLDVVERNIATLQAQASCRLIQQDVAHLPRCDAPYDIVFVDPPYEAALHVSLLISLVEQGWVHEASWIITEQDAKSSPINVDVLCAQDQRLYGRSLFTFWQLYVALQ
ncbi:MAG: 16S rRNA (guanine(966)-N(2))-methyltransferase RsmD [Sphaerospermopsis sp. SIO1G2]|nr:16S rRNA (guanine(966)-N(2))-methyltransferase RsmD [Sphaerospermopsis sp. SIO1G2]